MWDLRIVEGQTDFKLLAKIMDEFPKRRRSRSRSTARSVVSLKVTEKTPMEKLAGRFNLEEADIFSIKHSTETLARLAMYYGLKNSDVKHIKSVKL